MNLFKMLKRSASAVRLAALKAGLGPRVSWPRGGKPVYVGRGARIRVAEGVFTNANARIVAAESVRVGDHSMLGPNVCVYDRGHAFGENGVSGDLVSFPVEIGERCWIGANSLVTRGARIADRICVGGCRHAPYGGAWRLRRNSREAHQAPRCARRGCERWA